MSQQVETQKKWREKNGVIYFSVTSNGMTGEQWIGHFKDRNLRIDKDAEMILRSRDFRSTIGISTEIGVLKGGTLFENDDWPVRDIEVFARENKFTTPRAEVACLIYDMFSVEDVEAMGLWAITTMHKTILCSLGNQGHLQSCYTDMAHRLGVHLMNRGDWLRRGHGFAFVVS